MERARRWTPEGKGKPIDSNKSVNPPVRRQRREGSCAPPIGINLRSVELKKEGEETPETPGSMRYMKRITKVHKRLTQIIAIVTPEIPRPNKVVGSIEKKDLLWDRCKASIQGILKIESYKCAKNISPKPASSLSRG